MSDTPSLDTNEDVCRYLGGPELAAVGRRIDAGTATVGDCIRVLERLDELANPDREQSRLRAMAGDLLVRIRPPAPVTVRVHLGEDRRDGDAT